MIYYSKQYTAAQAGSRLEQVTCERCETSYYYELAREGVGKASAVFGIDKAFASRRAESAAQRNLQKRLATEVELVPCPECHWVNEAMIERYRRRLYRGAPGLIATFVFAGLIFSLVIAGGLRESFDQDSPIPQVVGALAGLVFLAAAMAVLPIRNALRRRVDPNAFHPAPPTLPPGTPPALIEEDDPETGEARLVPSSHVYDAPAGEWVTFRPGQFVLPALCCVCMAQASTRFRTPMPFDQTSDVAVPLCDACSRRLRWRWCFMLLGFAGIGAAIAAIVAGSAPGLDLVGRWILFGLGTCISLIVGVIFAGWASRPYRLVVIDKDRGIFKFSVQNEEFMELLHEWAIAPPTPATEHLVDETEASA